MKTATYCSGYKEQCCVWASQKNFALANQSKVSNREGTGSPGLGNLKFKFKFKFKFNLT